MPVNSEFPPMPFGKSRDILETMVRLGPSGSCHFPGFPYRCLGEPSSGVRLKTGWDGYATRSQDGPITAPPSTSPRRAFGQHEPAARAVADAALGREERRADDAVRREPAVRVLLGDHRESRGDRVRLRRERPRVASEVDDDRARWASIEGDRRRRG